MERTRNIKRNEHRVFELPEEMTGRELKKWSKGTKSPIFKRKMKRTKFPKKVNTKKEKNLRLIAKYIKGNPEMKRTKFIDYENSL